MSYVTRALAIKQGTEKTFRLLGEGACTGKIYGAAVTDGGAMPRFMPVPLNYTPSVYSVKRGYAAKDGAMFLVSNLKLYCKPAGDTEFTVIAEGLARVPFFCEYNGGILISDGVTNYTYADGALTSTEAVVGLYAGVIHYSRLFGVDDDGLTIRWSAPSADDSWAEGLRFSGWLTLPPQRGKILQLVPYDDKLIAVREQGLTVIKAYGQTENFRVSGTDTDTDKIVDGTAAVCAGKLFFVAYSGLYSYDGSDIKRECGGLDGLGRVYLGGACGNYYFCTVYLDGDTALACIDGESGELSFCNIAPDCLFSCGDIYLPSGGTLYKLYYPSYGITYNSGYTCMDTLGKKYLKYLIIDCEEECDITVKANGVSRIFTGVSGKVDVKMHGDKFLFTVSSTAAVYSLDAVMEV